MSSKLKLSSAATEKLNSLSINLNLKKNVICRMAFCESINSRKPVSDKIENDIDGLEFNKSTILGSDELMFNAMASYIQGKQYGDDTFNIIIRNHIENGLFLISDKYEIINSPVGFLESIVKT